MASAAMDDLVFRLFLRRKQQSSHSQRQNALAERKGFEPSIRFWRIHTFQACAFDHSATSLFYFARKIYFAKTKNISNTLRQIPLPGTMQGMLLNRMPNIK